MNCDSIAPILAALCAGAFVALLVIDHFQEPSQEEFESWADEITRYETE